MLKRLLDILISLLGLLLLSPVLIMVAAAVFLYDRHNPIYAARRIARGGGTFRMLKFRSMVINADKLGGSSTGANDARITPIGKFIRSWKLDELLQLVNVLVGNMSFVGPRPQTHNEAALFTHAEMRIFLVRPGITDPASIVFSDEGEILRGSANPELLYNQIIRPWKSRLALAYIDHRSVGVDLWVIVLTVVTVFNKSATLRLLRRVLESWDIDSLVVHMAARQDPLMPYPPPGGDAIPEQV